MNKDFDFDEDEVYLDGLSNLKLPDPSLLDYYKRIQNREIWVNINISDNLIEFTQQIIDWNREDEEKCINVINRKPIKIFINSNGGSVNTIMHFITVIQLSKTPVFTIGMGKCYSAGALLLMGGHKGKRLVFDSTHALIHDGSSGTYGDTGKVIDTLEYTKKIEEESKKYILNNSAITEELYDKNYRKDWWMDSNEILLYGLADKVIEDLRELF